MTNTNANWDLTNDLDQKILNTWDIVDDLRDLVKSIEAGEIDIDETKDFLSALATVYQLKFEQLHSLNTNVFYALAQEDTPEVAPDYVQWLRDAEERKTVLNCGAQCDEEVLDFGKPDTSSEVVKASCNCRWPPGSNLSCDDELYE